MRQPHRSILGAYSEFIARAGCGCAPQGVFARITAPGPAALFIIEPFAIIPRGGRYNAAPARLRYIALPFSLVRAIVASNQEIRVQGGRVPSFTTPSPER